MGKKDKRDHRHKRKKDSHKHKSRHRSPSTSSTSSEEWVEKAASQKLPDSPKVRDEWMSMDTCFSGKTRKELNDEKKKDSDKSGERVNILDQLGQSSRELNPFWKNGGTGLPSECETRKTTVSSGVGDNGVHWLRKSLERAKEKADEEGRSLDDVISERWGSLDEFNRALKDAEKNDQKQSYSRYDSDKNSDRYRHRHGNDRHRHEYNDRHRHEYNDRHDTNKKRLNFKKPDEDSYSSSKTYKNYESQSSRRNWRKPSSSTSSIQDSESKDRKDVMPSQNLQSNNDEEDRATVSCDSSESDVKILSLNELNHLYAAVLRAELTGNTQLARKFESEAKIHKQRRKNALKNKEIRDDSANKVVILTETDSRGFTRPVQSLESGNHSRKRKTETHEGQTRVRYFADDDKYSLKDMFEREKYNAVDDDQSTFIKLVAKETQDDMDVEGVFDQARMGESSKDENKKRAKLIKQHIALEKSVENCRWCIDGKMMEECLVLSKSKVYVAAPTSQSLTERHCLIIPYNHISCGTLLDEDVWEEIMELRKKMVQKLEEDDEDIIFFEIANNLHKHPHMVLHCVPVPKECGDTAPIYFKKAIMECETEWSNNKKVVDLAGRDVRKAVPKGLPYFSVDFGMQSGYAHVIEDNRLFPTNFGQEIIGGMLDLDHTIWRKPRRDLSENIIKKVELIKKLFEDDS
ncbi:CWF19-like protein 2 [Halyomorpha halys]|uniref:CWF19-like protein 2 n=1 Tax=Halyomorpha halys TaxID=286706 RepID=UPI0006D4CFD4|nr:CWF19-like protein 2 [Halyomorpha halys]